MISDFLDKAKRGESVYLYDVREVFSSCGSVVECVVELAVGNPNYYIIPVPRASNSEEAAFIKDYFNANVYNLISVLGGKRLLMYINPDDDHIKELCAALNDVFQISVPRKERSGYGKALNVTDRVNAAMGFSDFSFEVVYGKYEKITPNQVNPAPDALSVFRGAVTAAKNAIICGMDIGGTDIKVVGSVNGRIKVLKEYDWRPSDIKTVNEMLLPIILIVKVIRAALTLPDTARGNELRASMLNRNASEEEMASAIETAQKEFGEFILLDGIGVNFPDVVINNKIVGGETPKTQGIRRRSPDYETEFRQITKLDSMLLTQCTPGATVRIANDGSLAAYTAAVELAHSDRADEVTNGVFAHTLGTDLGSGWIDENGEIPQIPLELYNCVIDLGNFPAQKFDAFDLRSTRNYTTGMTGSPQKYAGQSGAYRFAIKYFSKDAPRLYQELIEKGFIEETNSGVFVVFAPNDMRKPLLEHIFELADNGYPQAEQIFRDIGKFLAAVWQETEFILSPKTKRRTLYGRFIKYRNCFALMQEGAKELFDINLDAGDGTLAFTPLMKDLKDDPVFTVAQFGQAVGAVYFAASSLKRV
jgi:predicted NBD/HSP70 family sugar kinase